MNYIKHTFSYILMILLFGVCFFLGRYSANLRKQDNTTVVKAIFTQDFFNENLKEIEKDQDDIKPGRECLEKLCRWPPCNQCFSNGDCCYNLCSSSMGCEETVLYCAPSGTFCSFGPS